ncbi:putative Nudix hydrolase YfcD [Actinokineospora spheciospongiae]|uniref:Putative Nudix hydrolase YfcD n=1 Tax=Actinokineospora spheciospongiae TaxID=909613 RepID=W7IT73_9PSEU|nr:NUDIX domain-containing protein [Actinokineospora spheciospongiae]EWC64080.1 putative Nudix hydrolase YfcD [Actinokineospora spheciospongiae]
MDELVDLYARGDLGGRVVGTAPRSRVRAENLPHAATQVLLRDRAGRVYVHRRTLTKDVYPGMHDVWAGGVVTAGEAPDVAAARELAEELGVRTVVRPCFRYWYADDSANYLACVYEADHPGGEIRHQASEVAAGWWVPWAELLARLADPAWPFTPDGRESVARYARYAA